MLARDAPAPFNSKDWIFEIKWDGIRAISYVNDGLSILSRNGKELFYRNRDKMMVVAVVTQPTFQASKPRLLWEGRYSHGMSSSCGPPGTTEGNYDVTGDGRRFLMIKDLDEDAVSTRIVVVLNFAEELKGLGKEQRQ